MTVLRQVREFVQSGRARQLLSLLTPQQAEGRGPLPRLLLATATGGLLAAFMTTALLAAAVMMGALGGMYYLLTYVLGVRLSVDPQAMVEQVRRHAGSYSPPN